MSLLTALEQVFPFCHDALALNRDEEQGVRYRMAKIVLSTIGVRGDLNRFLSLGLGLRARGHDVLFAVEEILSQGLIDEGFAVHRLPGDVKETLLPYIRQLVGGFTPRASLRFIV